MLTDRSCPVSSSVDSKSLVGFGIREENEYRPLKRTRWIFTIGYPALPCQAFTSRRYAAGAQCELMLRSISDVIMEPLGPRFVRICSVLFCAGESETLCFGCPTSFFGTACPRSGEFSPACLTPSQTPHP
jgi:hypothetical protein